MDAMPVRINHLYYYQSSNPQKKRKDGGILYEPDSLALLSNHKVSFNNKSPQGEWQFDTDRSVLHVTLNWRGEHQRPHVHEFHAVAGTSVFVLVLRNGGIHPHAVLVPRFLPPLFEAASKNEPSEPSTPSEPAAKRRRTSKGRAVA